MTDTTMNDIKDRQAQELQKHAEERDQFINRVKKMVGQPVDNINNPIPFAPQLAHD